MGVKTGFSFIFLKKGRERLPQPGILTLQPEEIKSNNNNIAENIDKLFNVSRNRESLVEIFQLTSRFTGSLCFSS
jgi:hypothetical protein